MAYFYRFCVSEFNFCTTLEKIIYWSLSVLVTFIAKISSAHGMVYMYINDYSHCGL